MYIFSTQYIHMELLANTLFINLDERADRLAHVETELSKMGIAGERVKAVKMKVGAIGCTLSHIRCLEIAKERKYPHVFICEDDITFTNPELLKTNLQKFCEDNDDFLWDVLIIGGNNVPPFNKITDYYSRVLHCQTTTGYIVQSHYYNTLIANFKESAKNLMTYPNRKKEFALDMYWKRLQIEGFWFMITPPTVTQYESYSDIEERNVNYDFLMLDMEKTWFVEQNKKLAEMQTNPANSNNMRLMFS